MTQALSGPPPTSGLPRGSPWYDDSVFETLDKDRDRELFGLTPRAQWI